MAIKPQYIPPRINRARRKMAIVPLYLPARIERAKKRIEAAKRRLLPKKKPKLPRIPTPPPTKIYPSKSYNRQVNKRQTQFLIKEQLEE